MKKQFSRLDILINNAGGPPLGSFTNFNDNNWDQAINLNLMSVIRFTKSCIPINERK